MIIAILLNGGQDGQRQAEPTLAVRDVRPEANDNERAAILLPRPDGALDALASYRWVFSPAYRGPETLVRSTAGMRILSGQTGAGRSELEGVQVELPEVSLLHSDPPVAVDIAAIICGPYGWAWLEFQGGCAWALALVDCESSGNVNAYSRAGPYVSWWQILNGPFDGYLSTVEANIQFKEWLAGKRSVSPWPVCAPDKP